MSPLALHFASGAAFFSGSLVLITGWWLARGDARRWLRTAGRVLLFVGVLMIAVSAAALPWWLYSVWFLSLLASCLVMPHGQSGGPIRSKVSMAAFFTCTAFALCWEGTYQIRPAAPQQSYRQIIVLGDSISAGEFVDHEQPWPALLAAEHQLEVLNLAYNGATVASIAKRLPQEISAETLVILEIGGNDILGDTSVRDFEAGLERILQHLGEQGAHVVMLELPLPPFYNGFGLAQRRLASRYGATLVPRRLFADVFSGEAATLDGLHLSPEGHQRMARMIWSIIATKRAPQADAAK